MIEYKNLTTGSIGSVEYGSEEMETLQEQAQANDWEIAAWFRSDTDTEDAARIAPGEHSLFACIAIASWIEDAISDGSHVILTDDELENEAKARIRDYLDDCVMPGLPEIARRYFDEDSFIRDCLLSDGPEHCAGLEPVDQIDTDAGRIRVRHLYQQA